MLISIYPCENIQLNVYGRSKSRIVMESSACSPQSASSSRSSFAFSDTAFPLSNQQLVGSIGTGEWLLWFWASAMDWLVSITLAQRRDIWLDIVSWHRSCLRYVSLVLHWLFIVDVVVRLLSIAPRWACWTKRYTAVEIRMEGSLWLLRELCIWYEPAKA